MIQLITRAELFATKPVLRSEITALQKAFYETGIQAIYRQEDNEAQYLAQFDCEHEIIYYTATSRVISFIHDYIDDFPIKLALRLINLCSHVGATQFALLSHLKIDFFGNRNATDTRLQYAYRQLEKIIGQGSYHEALLFSLDDMIQVIEIIFWIVRLDAGAPDYLFIFDQAERFNFFICKFGNVHLTDFNKTTFTKAILTAKKWQLIEGLEYDKFSTDSLLNCSIQKQ